MIKKTSILTLIFVSVMTISSFAQNLGINFALGFPQGEFKDNVSRTGLGIGGELLLPTVPGSPVNWGFNLIFMNYGDETRRAPWSYTIPDLTVDVNRQNNFVAGHAVIRIAPPSPLFKPYLDLMAGGKYIWTQTSVKSRSASNNLDVASDENFSDWAFSYGGGAGIMFSVYNEMGTNVMIDIKARYLFGSTAQYLAEGDVVVNTTNGTVKYNTRRSKTDMLFAQIGVNLTFDSMNF